MIEHEMIIVIFGILNIIYLIGFVLIILWVAKINKKVNDLQEMNKKNEYINKGCNEDIFADSSFYQFDAVEKQAHETDGQQKKTIDDTHLFNTPKITIRSETVYKPRQLDGSFPFFNSINLDMYGLDVPGYLVFNKFSIEKLRAALDWGRKTIRNQVEQGGILLGNAGLYQGTIYCFAEDILLAKTNGMPAFVEFTQEMWRDMQNELVMLNEQRKQDDKLIILGWFHTHPNNLSVFMSGTDMGTQRLNFPLDWQISLVMNPHKNIYRVFFGKDADEGRIIFQEDISISDDGRD